MEKLKGIYRFLNPKFQSLHLDYPVDMKPRNGHGKEANPFLYDVVNANRKEYQDLLTEFSGVIDGLRSIDLHAEPGKNTAPAWINGFFPGLDTVGLYGMLSLKKPARYVEIGSGNSTFVARKAIQDHQLNTRLTSIDPFPRTEVSDMADEVMRFPLQDHPDPTSIASMLEAGDFLFIDNSHRSLPNSDVTVCFMELIPALKPGVIVHVHDIYIPYDYPQFMCDRAYNEQYLLAVLLMANPSKYHSVLPNYFISEDEELSGVLQPFWNSLPAGVEQHGGSYWFEVR